MGQRGDEGVGGVGAENADGVGVEGDGEGVEGEGVGSVAGVYLVDDPAMAAVDAVEVADAGNGGAEVGRDFGEGAKDLHAPGSGSGAMSKSSFRPS